MKTILLGVTFLLFVIASVSAVSMNSDDVERITDCYVPSFIQTCTWGIGPAYAETDLPSCYDLGSSNNCPVTSLLMNPAPSRIPLVQNKTATFITPALSKGESIQIPGYLTAGKDKPRYYIIQEQMTPNGPLVIKGDLSQNRMYSRWGHNTRLDIEVKGAFRN